MPASATTPVTTAIDAPASVRSRMALASLCLSMMMSSLDTSIAHTSLPALAQAFKVPFSEVNWVILAYLIAVTALAAGAGRFGDLLGRRRVLLAGLTLFTLASAACAAAPTLGWLVAARATQGVGAAVMMALTVACVADLVPPTRRGSTLGLLGTMSAIGTTLGPTLGGLLTEAFGWPSIFLVNLPLGVLNVIGVAVFLPRDASRESARSGTPALSPLREPGVLACLGMTTLVSAVLMTTLVVGPFHLGQVLGLSPAMAGLVLSVGPMVAALCGMPAGRLVDHLGAGRMTVLALAGVASGCALLAALPSSLPAYAGPLVLITASYALFQSANGTLLMNAAGSARRGALAGWMGLARNAGLIAGTAGMGALFASRWSGAGALAPVAGDVAAGMRITFAVAAALMLFALVLARAATNSVARAAKA